MPGGSTVFSYTGAAQSYTVPVDATTVTIECWGGSGGNYSSHLGGKGGYAKMILAVTAGEVLQVNVGGEGVTGGYYQSGSKAGGWNGGGLGYATGAPGGGGASDVRRNGTALANRIIVAGGGGGSGAGGPSTPANTPGGDGGGLTGQAGTTNTSTGTATGGGGGTQAAGGAKGGGTSTQDGSLGLGGNGSNSGSSSYQGGGGGGGYYGGGGGGAGGGNTGGGGGGGGSSYTDPAATGVVHTQGARTGNGEVIITYDVPYPPYTPKPTTVPPIRTEILADGPYAYYPLDDPEKSEWGLPTDITGLVAWLNPNTISGEDGSLVATAPAVGANPQWVATYGNAPYLRRNGLNGHSYIEVHGDPDYRGLVCDINLSGASTVFLVARLRGTNNVPSDPGRVLTSWRNNWILGWHGSQMDRAYFEGWIYGEGTAVGQTAGPTADLSLRTYAGVFTAVGGNDGHFYRNGEKLTENSAAGAGPNGLALAGYMGVNGPQLEHSDADVYEVIAYNRVLTATEMGKIHGYLRRHGTVTHVVQDTAVADASGNGRTATMFGVVEKGKKPLLRRGFSAKTVSTSRSGIFTPFTTMWPEFTIEVLVRPEGAAANGEIISKRSYWATATTDFPFAVTHGTDDKISVIFDSGNDFTADVTLTSTSTFPRGTTHHVVVVGRSNSVCELYVNGVQEAAQTIGFTIGTGTRNWTLGATAFENGGGVGGLRFEGSFQHWAIYDKALTATRIAAHYAAAIPPPPTTWQGTTYPSLVASHGAIAYWRLGETSGTTAVDQLGTVNGTYNAVTLGTPGLIDSTDPAATFNGSVGTRVQMPDVAPLNITSGSLEVWFKTSNAGAGHRGIAMRHFMYGLFLFDNLLCVYDWGGGANRVTAVNCADGLTHHAVVTFQSGVVNGTKIYLDGSPVMTTSMTNASNPGAFVIGSGNPDGSIQNFAGIIDEVAVYSTILSEAQVAEHNTVGRTAPVLSVIDSGYWTS